MSPYPATAPERDRWIVSHRPARRDLDPFEPYAVLVEEERGPSGEVSPVLTVFLTNRECPWRCLMCDLWKNTLPGPTPAGAIPRQLERAWEMAGLRERSTAAPKTIKLYNSGSFFDPRAIPLEDHPALVSQLQRFERVIVECHPALINERVLDFRNQLPGQLELAVGLESAHPVILERLNKRMTLAEFEKAARFLAAHQIDLRTFVLIKPPFLQDSQTLEWTQKSAAFAFHCGASVVSLIPTRLGNGALEILAAQDEFAPPSLALIERATLACLPAPQRLFVDTWDLRQFSSCTDCFDSRLKALAAFNHTQHYHPPDPCATCGFTSPEHSHPTATPSPSHAG